MRIDHVLLAAADIEATAERLLSEYGLVSVTGGTHPSWGTANRIVPLGGQYLEIIGVVDTQSAAQNPFGQWILRHTANGDSLAGFMVEPDDFDDVCARLKLASIPGERIRPDGTRLAWRLAGVSEAISRTVPCFITWEVRDDAFDGDAGVGATGIAELVLSADPDDIRVWAGGDVEGLSVVSGPPALMTLRISTTQGTIVIPGRLG